LADGGFVRPIQTRVRAVSAGTNGLEQLDRPRNATDGFSGYGHGVAEPATAAVSEYSSTEGRADVRQEDMPSVKDTRALYALRDIEPVAVLL
jgi:hypothetical protein